MRNIVLAAAALTLAACETSEVVRSEVMIDNEYVRVWAEDVDEYSDLDLVRHQMNYYATNKSREFAICVGVWFSSHTASAWRYGDVVRMAPRQQRAFLGWGSLRADRDLRIDAQVRTWAPGVDGLADDCSNMPAALAD